VYSIYHFHRFRKTEILQRVDLNESEETTVVKSQGMNAIWSRNSVKNIYQIRNGRWHTGYSRDVNDCKDFSLRAEISVTDSGIWRLQRYWKVTKKRTIQQTLRLR
jgi:hypothetical protein